MDKQLNPIDLPSNDRAERQVHVIDGVRVRLDIARGSGLAGYCFVFSGALCSGAADTARDARAAARRHLRRLVRHGLPRLAAPLCLVFVLLAACGDDAAIADDDQVTVDADVLAPDARADADPGALDAGADADPGALDAGADADPAAPDAAASCSSLPCYYDCDAYAGTGCPIGGGCYLAADYVFNGATVDGYTWCSEPGLKLPGETCDTDNECVPGNLCLTSTGFPPGTCYELCTSSHPGCQCTVLQGATFHGEIIRYCS